MHEIETSFKKAKIVKSKKRKKKKLYLYSATLLFLIAILSSGYYYTYNQWSFSPPKIAENELENELSRPENGFDSAENEEASLNSLSLPAEPLFSPVILDLAGDPLTLKLEQDNSSTSNHRTLVTPPELLKQRIGAKVKIIQDNLISKSDLLMTTLPSSQEDFAFFRSQRDSLQSNIESYIPLVEDPFQSAGILEDDILDDSAGWGEVIGNNDGNLTDFLQVEVKDTTSSAFTRNKDDRFSATEEFIIRSKGTNLIKTLLVENGISLFDANLVSDMMSQNFALKELNDGGLIAVRAERKSASQQTLNLVQVSAYSDYEYLGTLAMDDSGEFKPSGDPWNEDDLLDREIINLNDAPARKYRLLDGIYSTAARNQVPSSVIGEAIIHLSRSYDLNVFALPEDKLILIYADRGRGLNGTAGKVLYVGIERSKDQIHCFVFAAFDSYEFSCNGIGNDSNGKNQENTGSMVTPVKGVLTSRFGPRTHPILKTVRVHKGVDWAAPTGTPVVAAFDGIISTAGDGRGYGNLVRIKHDNGRETRYAHLSKFSKNAKPGTKVSAGDVIGFVGTTGFSTGPHLHFELREGVKAIDPLKPSIASVVASVSKAYKSGSNAVERLVDKIIRVESAGNARAKNPLSSATGLGQFISSTWVRMMRTYRPDLARRLSQQQLLDLRFDPTISREMVRNLAREGESYLRIRGHGITAGRLYLAHFLGMDGAHQVLSANRAQSLQSILGSGVIKANPFLRGKNVAYVQEWAERKMQVRVSKRANNLGRDKKGETGITSITEQTVEEVTIAPGFMEYREAMERILKQVKELI